MFAPSTVNPVKLASLIRAVHHVHVCEFAISKVGVLYFHVGKRYVVKDDVDGPAIKELRIGDIGVFHDQLLFRFALLALPK